MRDEQQPVCRHDRIHGRKRHTDGFCRSVSILKTGVVDGAENNPPSYESTNHFEVAKYYSISEHLIIPACLCMSKKTWDSLSAEDQRVIMEAGHASALKQRELRQAREAKSMEAVVAWLVFGRYVLNETPTWVEQSALVLVCYIAFIGAAVGVRDDTHLGPPSMA